MSNNDTVTKRCPECGSASINHRKTKQPRYRCWKGHEFDWPDKEIHWDELKPAVLPADQLWNPYRVNIEVEDFGTLDVEVDNEGMQDFVERFVEVCNSQAV